MLSTKSDDTVKSLDSGAKLSEFQSQPLPLWALWFWPAHFTSFCLGFLIFIMGVILLLIVGEQTSASQALSLGYIDYFKLVIFKKGQTPFCKRHLHVYQKSPFVTVSPSLYQEEEGGCRSLEILLSGGEGRELNLHNNLTVHYWVFPGILIIDSQLFCSELKMVFEVMASALCGSYSVFLGGSHRYRTYTCY